jgi:hypothetical protein
MVIAGNLQSTTTTNTPQTILGKRFQVKNSIGDPTRRRVTASGQERGSANTVEGDPTVSGATLRIIANGGTDSDQTLTLPAVGWAARPGGFQYSNRLGGGTVRGARFKKTASGTFQIRIDVRGNPGPLDVVPPSPGTSGGFILTIGDGDSYCVGFGETAGGTAQKDDATQWSIRSAVAEACPAPTP